MKLINRRELNKRIVAVGNLKTGGFSVKHDMPGEAIICEVPTLEIAGCIVKCLRARAQIKLAEQLLSEHMVKKRRKL